MASTEVVTANGDIGPQYARDQIIRALQVKREQLDRDIEEYKAQKEKEYAEFEQQIQRLNLNGGQDASQPFTTQSFRLDDPKDTPKRPTHQRRDSSERRASRRQCTARQALDQAFGIGFEEGGEWEGVFTPEYLGLIDGNKHHSNNGHGNGNGNLQPTPASTSLGEQKLSSSATLHPPLNYPGASSVPDARPVSSSAPEQSPSQAHHRSNSASSAFSLSSLRSSMKDPRTPKSPKRVLFNIEDGVVSPSTSPTMNRKTNGAHEEGDAVENVLFLAKRGKENKKKSRRKERVDGDRGRRGGEELEGIRASEARGFTKIPPVGRGWTKPMPMNLRHPPHPNSIAKPTTAEDYENIEKVDDEDLFTFDEDLDVPSARKPVGPQDEIDEHDDDLAGKSLPEMGTSPHAGSLPIEIKWPGRRDIVGAG